MAQVARWATPLNNRRIAKYHLGIHLLGVQTIAANQQFFDRFHGPQTTGKQRIVKYQIAAGNHVGLHAVVGTRHSTVNIAINTSLEPARCLQRRPGGIFKTALNKSQIGQPHSAGVLLQCCQIGIGKIAGLVQVNGAVGLRHAGESVQGVDVGAGGKLLGQIGQKDGSFYQVSCRIPQCGTWYSRQMELTQQKEIHQVGRMHHRALAGPCEMQSE